MMETTKLTCRTSRSQRRRETIFREELIDLLWAPAGELWIFNVSTVSVFNRVSFFGSVSFGPLRPYDTSQKSTSPSGVLVVITSAYSFETWKDNPTNDLSIDRLFIEGSGGAKNYGAEG